jgi:hypothetical protein
VFDAVEWKPCAQRSPPSRIAAHVSSAALGVLSDIGTPSSLDVQQIADQRRTISAFGVGLAPRQQSRPRNSPSRRHFESEAGSIPVRTLWRPERHGACPAAGEPAVLFLPANTARLLVGSSVGIGNNRLQKLV